MERQIDRSNSSIFTIPLLCISSQSYSSSIHKLKARWKMTLLAIFFCGNGINWVRVWNIISIEAQRIHVIAKSYVACLCGGRDAELPACVWVCSVVWQNHALPYTGLPKIAIIWDWDHSFSCFTKAKLQAVKNGDQNSYAVEVHMFENKSLLLLYLVLLTIPCCKEIIVLLGI